MKKIYIIILSLFTSLNVYASHFVAATGDLQMVVDESSKHLTQHVLINNEILKVNGFNKIKKSLHNVPIWGFKDKESITLSNTSQLESLATATTTDFSWSTGPKQVLVIRVDFSDVPANLTQDAVQSIMDTQVNPYFVRSSYGQTNLTTTVSRVYRMPQPSTYYKGTQGFPKILTDAQNAASVDYTLNSFDRIVIQSPHFIANPTTGAKGTIGISYIDGKQCWVGTDNFGGPVITHELGHTYGLYHASGWVVTDGNPTSASGKNAEYGDPFDIMGSENNLLMQDYNPYFKHGIGWIPDGKITIVNSSGTFTFRVWAFDNSSSLSSNRLAVKIPRDSRNDFWISVRRANKNNIHIYHGLYIQWGYPAFLYKSYLLDMNTVGTNFGDAPLNVGQTFTDSATGISIQALDEGGVAPFQYMDVEVKMP